MKKWVLSLTLATSLVGLSACGGGGAVVKTDAGNVTKDELYQAMKEKVGEQMVQQLVLEKVLSKEYSVTDKELDKELEKMKAELGAQFQMVLAQYGYQNEEDFREALKLNMLQEKAAVKDIKVTEDEVKEYYDQKEPDIKVRHIIVEDEKTAKEVKAKLDKGEDFAKLAEKYSKDGTAQTGGDLGTISRDDPNMDEDFKVAAYKLKKDEISNPVKSQFGWHIIQVTDKPEKQAYDKVKNEYEYELKVSKLDQETMLNSLKKELKKSDVKIEDEDLKTALDSILNFSADQADDNATSDGNTGKEKSDK